VLKVFVVILSIVPLHAFASQFTQDLANAAIERTTHNVTYDGSYFSLSYPNGDVPSSVGVCTDVIIRTYRTLNIDFQKLVHEDMLSNFDEYPSKRIWGLTKPDKNIDHRRVPNLQVFLSRHGVVLPITKKGGDYKVGDIVTWMLPGNLPHVGIISNKVDKITQYPLVVHNIGAGPKLDDMLFSYKITGHYRYEP